MGLIRLLLITFLTLSSFLIATAKEIDFSEVAVNDSLRQMVMRFGQLADLSFDERRKQIREQSTNEQGEFLFRKLFTLNEQEENTTCTIFNFINPQLDIASCYSSRNHSSNEDIWNCIEEKMNQKQENWSITIEEYIYLITKFYSKTFSYIGVPLSPEEIGMNKIDPTAIIDIVEESKVKLSKTRFQKVAAAPIAFSGDWIDYDNSNSKNTSYLIRDDYNCKLVFYISFDMEKISKKNIPQNFKIDSICHLPPILDIHEYVQNNSINKKGKTKIKRTTSADKNNHIGS